ncbi:MAG TPA: class I SAM-dependent methyltransferase [Rhodanobacteraceae bacterium]|nr:class I SAM-dependent methyltransferase [Rhodanobacteraceae bacterium]
MSSRSHWEDVYRTKRPHEVSWYRPHLDTSLAMIEAAVPDRAARIVDAGGGASTLVDDLLARGYRNPTVLELSSSALDIARARLDSSASQVDWRCGDVTSAPLPANAYDLWHDRAVFHFLTSAKDRAAYVAQVKRSVKPGGHVIVATFAPEGPAKCSGLDVVRYSADALGDALGDAFRPVQHRTELHETPAGRIQPFTYAHFRLAGS